MAMEVEVEVVDSSFSENLLALIVGMLLVRVVSKWRCVWSLRLKLLLRTACSTLLGKNFLLQFALLWYEPEVRCWGSS